jgi:transcriptional regulator NrdR family protein
MMVGRPYKCPYCSSTRTSWKGWRRRQDGKVRLRRCQVCKRRFTTRVVVSEKAAEAKPQ